MSEINPVDIKGSLETKGDISEKEIKEELRRIFLGGDDWSKEACMGYFIKACENTSLDIKVIQELAQNLYKLFDTLTVEDAKKFYYTQYHTVISDKNKEQN